MCDEFVNKATHNGKEKGSKGLGSPICSLTSDKAQLYSA